MNSSTLLDRLERRFGHLAIPGLLRIIASFQLICFFLIYWKPGFEEVLWLTPAAWTEWEVWRFFTFCFIPQSLSIIWIIFAMMILLLIGDQLEAEWGKFRLNLYFLASVICLWVGMVCSNMGAGIMIGAQAGSLLYTSLFLAFATVVPDYIFMLFFILPVKVKYLAMLTGAALIFQWITLPMLRLPLLIAMLPYACFALPIAWRRLRHRARVTARRSVYRAASLPTGPAFHECRICHRTDHTDAALEFRIADDGEEYCAEHLP
jgi:Rhomboid family